MTIWTHTDRFESEALADHCGLTLRVLASFTNGNPHATARVFARVPGAIEVEIPHDICTGSLDEVLKAGCEAAMAHARSSALAT